MDKRKLVMTAGGASIVAAALAMNVGTAAADPGDEVCALCGDVFSPMQKIDSVIQKIETRFLDKFDKASPAIDALNSVLDKLNQIVIKFD